MPREKQNTAEAPAALAQRLADALQRERIVPRFVDSYVVEHGRHALQVHASLYRDLLALLQREALLAMTVRALEIAATELPPKPRLMLRKEAAAFRSKFLTAVTRQQNWTAGEALDFQRDLQMYEELLARANVTHRSRKPFEAANHPFVDRCAFLLDSPFMEKARLAASRALADLENLTSQVVASIIKPAPLPRSRQTR